MKVYRRHSCERQHRTSATFLRCAIPRAAWIVGAGDFAVIAWCRVPTVTLWPTPEAAAVALATIDAPLACGGRCQYRHEVVRVERGT